MATETEFKAVMEFLSKIYGEEIDVGRLRAYDLMLAHFPGEVLAAAAQLHVSRNDFFPKPAQLMRAAVEIMGTAGGGSGELDPYAAWEALQAEIRRVGYLGAPRFDQPALAEAVNRLGWRQLCLSDNQVSERARFLDCYQRIIESEVRRSLMPPAVEKLITLRAGAKWQLAEPGEAEHD
jgi:hypothetical protein